MTEFDVFVSYAREDADWVRVLAGRLHQAGLRVFLDEWEIKAGDVLVHSLDDAIRESASGILVVSPEALASRWVREEYAALLTSDRRFIPVLYRPIELPPLMASRVWVDFRHADGPAYDAAVDELVRALQGLSPGEPPALDQGLTPPGSTFAPEGPRRARLTAAADKVEVTDLDHDAVATAPPGPGNGLKYRLTELDRLRRGHGTLVTREAGDVAASAPPVQEALREVGSALGETFTPGSVGALLTALADDARGQHAPLRLQISADGDLTDLPWEALIPPGRVQPLALNPSIQLYRTAGIAGPAPALKIPGPLRILVVLASPEGDDGGPLLDVEHELATILDAVEPARKEARAYVRVLNDGTLSAIQEALTSQRFHVLHISCHAGPHTLLLEDVLGRPHRVSATELIDAIPVGRSPALIVLAGCSTAQSAHTTVGDATKALPGLARELLAAGIPQVIAMTAPVTDRYAAQFGGGLYRELALAPDPSVVTAVAAARRQVETRRQALPPGHPEASSVEWATPTIFVRGEPLPLYDPAAGMELLAEPPTPVLASGIPLRAWGDFVGRRAELRVLGAKLRTAGHAGLLVHGIGGVGKSTLVAELLRLLGADTGLTVSLVGLAGADQILNAFGLALFTQSLGAGLPDSHPDRQLSAYLRAPSEPWQDRLGTALTVLADRPVTLLLDNFETNLDAQPDGIGLIRDETLAAVLTGWIRSPGRHRVVITSRYPFRLPDDTERRLTIHHLGPLSFAETRKLIWRLPALDALTPEQQHQAWTDVGGHPRTLEYLDALLRQGEARFPDVTERLRGQLAAGGIDHPEQRIPDPGGHDAGSPFDRSVAEVVTVAVNDTLLQDLVGLLNQPARALLVGAAVYRQPVDQLALAWQTADAQPTPRDPDREQRFIQLDKDLKAAREAGEQPTGLDQLGYTPQQFALLHADVALLRRPPLRTTTVEQPLLAILCGLGLLIPTRIDSEDQNPGGTVYFVHRWTATALARLYPDATRQAHDHAATYYTWRVRYDPNDPIADLNDQVEARYHYYTAGDLSAAIDLSCTIGNQLQTWSAWDWETRICQETIAWLPPDSEHIAAFNHQLGIIAQYRGDYPEAERQHQQALAIADRVGDRAGLAISYHELGVLAHLRGDYSQAERHYRQSLTLNEELGDEAEIARSYHQLGILAQARGDYPEAERLHRQSLTIRKEVGHQRDIAASYHQLGMLAQDRGDYPKAERLYRQSLIIVQKLRDRAGTARSYHQLGTLAQALGDHPEAERLYQESLTINEELGERVGVLSSYYQLGTLAKLRGDYSEAERRYERARTVSEELGNLEGVAHCCSQLGILYTLTERAEESVPLHCAAFAIRIRMAVPEARIDLHALVELRRLLGDRIFGEAAAQVMDVDSLARLFVLLDQAD